MCAFQTPSQDVGLYVVDEEAGSIELDHGQPLAVAPLEVRVAADVDLLELEPELVAERRELTARRLAEVAAVGVVERDAGYG